MRERVLEKAAQTSLALALGRMCLSYSLPPPDLGAVRTGYVGPGEEQGAVSLGPSQRGPERWSGSLLQD